jgi:hypothetical protein
MHIGEDPSRDQAKDLVKAWLRLRWLDWVRDPIVLDEADANSIAFGVT